MQENIIGSRVASFIVISHYNKLINLALCGKEDSPEFSREMDKIRHYVKAEGEEYNRVTQFEVDTYFNNFSNNKLNNLLDIRENNKLKERKRILDGNLVFGDNYLLSSIISGKICIDVIKDIDEKIDEMLFDGKIDEDTLNILKLYNCRYKYHYFTANNFVESIGISKNFNLKNIEKISYHEVEEAFGIKFIDNSQNIFLEYITSALDSLTDIDAEDEHEATYLNMLYFAKIKSLLPYLNKKSLERLSNIISTDGYKYNKTSALTKVKKLVDKKKEEFNK